MIKFTKLLSQGKFLLIQDNQDGKPFVIGSVYLEKHADLITDLLRQWHSEQFINAENEIANALEKNRQEKEILN